MNNNEKFLVHVHTEIDNPPWFKKDMSENHQYWIFKDRSSALSYIDNKLKSYPLPISKNDFYERKAYINKIELYSLIDTFDDEMVSTGPQEVEEPVKI